MQKAITPIVVISTGGTIDKAYFDALSEYQIGEPMVKKMLGMAKVATPFHVIELFRKDSLDLSEQDRRALCATVTALENERVLITHGTDTMTESAKALSSVEGKTIVFTGALSPARFAESDAMFNLGMAFAAVQILPPGAYVAMSGQVFRADQVRKDREHSRFVSTQD